MTFLSAFGMTQARTFEDESVIWTPKVRVNKFFNSEQHFFIG